MSNSSPDSVSPETDADLLAKLISTLEESDFIRREKRAKRIIWLSQHNLRPGVVVGPVDTMGMLSEAHDCFAEGLFIAALLLAVSFIEHTLFDELYERGMVKYGDSLTSTIKSARSNNVFPSAMLDRTDHLREIRNPFAHRKGPEHAQALGSRYIAQMAHPTTVLEADAKEALVLMYEYFRATLKEM